MVTILNSVTTKQRTPPTSFLDRAVLVSKPIGDLRSPSPWRPITLLNWDYKPLTATLAKCLGRIAGELVNPYQTCAISGRSIHNNLLIAQHLAYAQFKSSSGYVASLGHVKAFGQAQHTYLFAFLTTLDMPEHFALV